MRSIASILAILALAAACADDPAGPETVPGIEALVLAGGIAVANGDVVDRYYLAFESETAALVDLSFDPAGEAHWIRIPAGASRLVRWDEIHGFHAGAEAVVVHSWIRSVAHQVGGGIQWGAEGFVSRRVEL